MDLEQGLLYTFILRMRKIISENIEDTEKLAFEVASNFSSGVIALSGDLGSGKTTFTQGFAKALGISDKIISPTFVLIRQHPIAGKKQTLFHIDLYRLDNISLKESGIEEILNNPDNIVLIEWAEKAKDQLPKDTLWITFKTISENKREITVNQ